MTSLAFTADTLGTGRMGVAVSSESFRLADRARFYMLFRSTPAPPTERCVAYKLSNTTDCGGQIQLGARFPTSGVAMLDTEPISPGNQGYSAGAPPEKRMFSAGV